MRSCRLLNFASKFGTAGCNRKVLLGLLVMAGICSMTAVAQSAHVPGTGTVRETPPQVLNGSATLVQHYNPNQMLRLAIGLQPPHPEQERQFHQSGCRSS